MIRTGRGPQRVLLPCGLPLCPLRRGEDPEQSSQHSFAPIGGSLRYAHRPPSHSPGYCERDPHRMSVTPLQPICDENSWIAPSKTVPLPHKGPAPSHRQHRRSRSTPIHPKDAGSPGKKLLHGRDSLWHQPDKESLQLYTARRLSSPWIPLPTAASNEKKTFQPYPTPRGEPVPPNDSDSLGQPRVRRMPTPANVHHGHPRKIQFLRLPPDIRSLSIPTAAPAPG